MQQKKFKKFMTSKVLLDLAGLGHCISHCISLQESPQSRSPWKYHRSILLPSLFLPKRLNIKTYQSILYCCTASELPDPMYCPSRLLKKISCSVDCHLQHFTAPTRSTDLAEKEEEENNTPDT